MTTELMTTTVTAEVVNKVVLQGDLSGLSTEELVMYYGAVCRNAGFDPVVKPFDVMTLQGKKVLYPNKTASAQLTAMHGCTVNVVDKGAGPNDTYFVHVRVVKKDGSTVDDLGVVSISNLRGDAAANAIMKATTKAKRRAILSAFGIGGNDESETEGMFNTSKDEAAMQVIEAVVAEMTDTEQATYEDLRLAIVGSEDADGLTAVTAKLRKAPQIVKDKLRNDMAEAQERLRLVWKDGKYTEVV